MPLHGANKAVTMCGLLLCGTTLYRAFSLRLRLRHLSSAAVAHFTHIKGHERHQAAMPAVHL